jgi:GNAT superfamily N-acetyltransferase
LIELYASVGFSEAAPLPDGIWREILALGSIRVAVATTGATLVASATLITAPNLLRGGRLHGFLENVATHPDWQGQGFGRAVICFLLDAAWQADCHHVLLQSGRSDPRVHRFYEKLGFVAGLRTAYVAYRPT